MLCISDFKQFKYCHETLTSITIILSIPTLIASLWGMNVGVPFANNPFGFVIVIAISVLIALGSAVVMVRKNML